MAALSVTTHKATRTGTNLFKKDCDKLDFERRQGRARSEDVDDQIEPDEEPNDFQKLMVEYLEGAHQGEMLEGSLEDVKARVKNLGLWAMLCMACTSSLFRSSTIPKKV